jgi:chorismate mutase
VEKVALAAFVVHLLRLARHHVVKTPGMNVATNFMPRQTYEHVILSCHGAVNLIRLQRDVNPALPVALSESGSDCCETAFSQISGFGNIAALCRDGSVGGSVNSLSKLNTLQLYKADPKNPMKYGSRSHKADVDVRKHEEQTRAEGGVPLVDHKPDDVYVSAWRSGQARAELAAEQLKISMPAVRAHLWEKEAEEVAAMADSSAEEPLPPPPAEPSDEPDASAPAADDSDDGGGDLPPRTAVAPSLEVAPADDASVAEARLFDATRLNDALDRLLAAEAAPAAVAPAAADQFALTPQGGLVYKRTLLALFNNCTRGEQLSKDRLARVQQAGKQRTTARSSAPAADEPAALTIGSDFAMAFAIDGGAGAAPRHEWWIGRIYALHQKTPGRRSYTPVDEVSLEGGLVEGVQIVASWYKATDASRSEYKFGTVHDSCKYSLEHVIGLPRLTYKAETDTLVLDEADRQIAALDEALRATMPERAGSSRTVGEARQARAQQQQRERADWAPSPAARAEGAAQLLRDRAARAAARPSAREQQLNNTGRT